jgi:hypothetical protein
MCLPAKLWIDLDGNLHEVRDSHEEWANAHGHELEDWLDHGWVRVQNVPPPYLWIDFRLPLNAAQAKAVACAMRSHGVPGPLGFPPPFPPRSGGWWPDAIRPCELRGGWTSTA